MEIVPEGDPVRDAVANAFTNSSGNFSLNAIPGNYYIFFPGNGTVGNIGVLELQQIDGPIDLTSGNVTQNLQLPTANVDVTVKDA